MRALREWPTSGRDLPGVDPIVSPESPTRILLAATARALRGQDCADLGHQPLLSRLRSAPESMRRAVLTRAAGRVAVSASQAGEVDVERVARWAVAHYPSHWYPGAVLGSPHGAAVHLAMALGMPWLPAAFEIMVQWPNGEVDDPPAALAYGTRVTARLLAGNPGVAVRQVHDPVGRGALAGSTIGLTVGWRGLPDAYRRFLAARLAPGAPVLLLRDVRTWPVWDRGQRHTFQVGTPAGGLEPVDLRLGGGPSGESARGSGGDRARWWVSEVGEAEQGVDPGFEAGLRAWAGKAGGTLHRVLFSRSEALSAATADVYRGWLRAAGKSGDRCVVECGRLIDPWQVVRAGMVPYWCENATRRSVAGAEWWLAGSAPFSSVDVLPDPPGTRSPALAGLPQWLAVASFGRCRRAVDPMAAHGYPVTAVPTRHATEVLRGQPYDLPAPARLPARDALAGLRAGGAAGLLVS